MAQIIKELYWDTDKDLLQNITAQQNDALSRYIRFHLLSSSLALDLTGNTVKIVALKSNGDKIFNNVTIEDAAKGQILIELTSQCLAVVGDLNCQLQIYGANNSLLSSRQFIINVLSSINISNAVESADEFTALSTALAQTQTWNDEFAAEMPNLDARYQTRLNSIDSSLAESANNANLNSILNYNGSYDGITDNILAFNNAKVKGNVYFPQNASNNAVYYFATSPDFSNLTIFAEDGVLLSLPTTNYISFKTTVFKNNIAIISRDRNNTGKQIKNDYSSAVYKINNLDIDSGIYKLTKVLSSELTYTRRYQANKSIANISNAIINSSNKYYWDSSKLDFNGAYLNLIEQIPIVGTLYEVCTNVGTLTDSDNINITIADANNNFVVFQTNHAGQYWVASNQTGTWTGTQIGSAPSPAYRLSDGGSTIFGARVINANQIEIYINNIYITTIALTGFNKLGFGFNSLQASMATNIIQDFMKTTLNKSNYGNYLNIAIFGDSISFGEGSCISWADFLPNILQGLRGIAKVSVTNNSVSGETSAQQLARLQNINVGSYNCVCVMVGTNDLGQNVDVSTFESNLNTIINKIKSDGSIPIIGIFPMTTSNELTGYGVSNPNYFKGGIYRSTAMRVCSEQNVMIADVMGELGKIGADNIQLRDNVHPQPDGQLMLAKCFAKRIVKSIFNDL